MKKLIRITELSKEIGIPVRTLRTFVAIRKIPFLKVGHRSLLFDAERVLAALQRYEIKAVGAK